MIRLPNQGHICHILVVAVGSVPDHQLTDINLNQETCAPA